MLMKEFFNVVHFEEALEKLMAARPPQNSQSIGLFEAVNRITAEAISSEENLPAFNRSTVDGYALNAEDIYGCSESSPGFMSYMGEIKMGQSAEIELAKGQCCWIPTGGMLPAGANSVVMVEYTEKLDEKMILTFKPVGPFENVMQTGEDITSGQVILEKGCRIRPGDIGLLASLGVKSLQVIKPYLVGIISTGDEIVPLEQKLSPGEIRDVNSYALYAAVNSCGAVPTVYPLVKDQFKALQQTVSDGLAENDILLISGGSSVGMMDVTLEVLMTFPNARMLFHGIAVKPGKPTLAVQIDEKLVIGLPGHPVSALTVFYILAAPLLRPENVLNSCEGYLSVNLSSQAGRDDFIPAAVEEQEGRKIIQPLLGKSGLMSILSRAHGFIHIPYEKQGMKAGEKLEVIIY